MHAVLSWLKSPLHMEKIMRFRYLMCFVAMTCLGMTCLGPPMIAAQDSQDHKHKRSRFASKWTGVPADGRSLVILLRSHGLLSFVSFERCRFALVILAVLVSACGHDSIPAFSIGGTVAGLSGTGLVLQNNSTDILPVTSSGTFRFATPKPSSSTYEVTVRVQPSNPAQYCAVTNGSGVLTSVDVNNVSVICTTPTIGGIIKGYVGSGLELTLNGGNNLAIPSGATSFTFPSGALQENEYQIFFASRPSYPTQSCTITSAHGFVSSAAVSNVAIICDTNATFALQGSYQVVVSDGSNPRTCCDIITFHPDGTFLWASRCPWGTVVDTAPDHCIPPQKTGAGFLYGVYNFDLSTGAYSLVRYAAPAEVISTNPGYEWSMIRCPVAMGRCWDANSPGAFFDLKPIEGASGTLKGSFASRVSPDVVVFLDSEYVIVTTQSVPDHGIVAGVEWGCYAQTGTTSGSITPDLSSRCPSFSFDLNGTAGLAGLASIPYVITGPSTLQLGDDASASTIFERIVPN